MITSSSTWHMPEVKDGSGKQIRTTSVVSISIPQLAFVVVAW